MPRPLRIEFAGAVYHITSRGNARQPIFLNRPDCYGFSDILSSVIAGYDCVCHAYCLTENHYHLVMKTARGNLSRGMRQFIELIESLDTIWDKLLTIWGFSMPQSVGP